MSEYKWEPSPPAFELAQVIADDYEVSVELAIEWLRLNFNQSTKEAA